tara:strand:- start:1 stop:393 length:393 start_codon:yes stop_codon:yes gene_type:complete
MQRIISRQHVDTEVTELVGKRCNEILTVGNVSDGQCEIVYLFIEDEWLRVFWDVGVFFLNNCSRPNPEDDFGARENENYYHLSEQFDFQKQRVNVASIKDGLFKLGFDSGIQFQFEEQNDRITLKVGIIK